MSNSAIESTAAQALQQVLSESEQTTLARLLFEHIENQIKTADSKAWITITLNTLLATISATLIYKPLATIFTEVPSGEVPKALVGSIFFTIVVFGAILFSLWHAVKALKPALMASDGNNLFFFGNIARLQEPTFVKKFYDQTRANICNSLLEEVHAKAMIAERKFSLINRSLNGFFVALLFGALSQLLVLGGWLHVVFTRG